MLKFNSSFASMVFAVLLTASAVPAQQRAARPSPWHYVSIHNIDNYERGDISELKGKRRVFVSSHAFTDQDSHVYDIELRQQVLQALKKYGVLEVVSNPDAADFAVHFTARGGYGAGCEYYVVTRGAESGGGSFAPRVLQVSTTAGNNCLDWAGRRAANLVETVMRLQGRK